QIIIGIGYRVIAPRSIVLPELTGTIAGRPEAGRVGVIGIIPYHSVVRSLGYSVVIRIISVSDITFDSHSRSWSIDVVNHVEITINVVAVGDSGGAILSILY